MEQVHVRQVDYERGLFVRLKTLSVLGFDVDFLTESEHDRRLASPIQLLEGEAGLDRSALSATLIELGLSHTVVQKSKPGSARTIAVLQDADSITPEQIADLSRLTASAQELYLTSPAFDFGIFIQGGNVALWDSSE